VLRAYPTFQAGGYALRPVDPIAVITPASCPPIRPALRVAAKAFLLVVADRRFPNRSLRPFECAKGGKEQAADRWSTEW
jgi:hypothetical protein